MDAFGIHVLVAREERLGRVRNSGERRLIRTEGVTIGFVGS